MGINEEVMLTLVGRGRQKRGGNRWACFYDNMGACPSVLMDGHAVLDEGSGDLKNVFQ